MTTLDQQRALDAYQKAEAAAKQPGSANYRAYVDALPAAILTNGLGQALASERANGGDRQGGGNYNAHQQLYNNLAAWLQARIPDYRGDLLHQLMTHDEATYIQAQAEALAWLGWHKKFCRAFIARAAEDRG